MKYQQPYGVSDPNAAYINGNPSTGTMGSIPPAASIEYPQREIVNFITASGLSPTDADLVQLAKAVQNGFVNFGADQGTPNQIAVTLHPPITAYTIGLRLFIKMAYANTTQVVVNVNAIGGVPLVHADLSQLIGAELKVGQMIECIFDGANFQMMSGGSGGGIILMTAPRSVYVNAATGNDTAYDGSQATVSTTHGPFKTIQRALAEMTKYNLGGWDFNIYLADGTYNISASITMPTPNGSGRVVLIGNHATPAAVLVYNNGTGGCFVFSGGGNWSLDGLAFQTTATTPTDGAECLDVQGGCDLVAIALSFGSCAGSHFWIDGGGAVTVVGPIYITGSPVNSHISCTAGSVYQNYQATSPALLFNGFTCFAFVYSSGASYVEASYASITAGGVANCAKYYAVANGIVDVLGRGASYLPGTIAGVQTTGGQLI
jgi:hypothetical protein